MMTKLHKRTLGKFRYFEAWIDGGNVVVHWGTLGRVGRSKTYAKPRRQSAERAIEEALRQARGQGFVEIDEEAQQWVIVQYRIKGFGSKRDLAKLQRVEDRLNNRLGWTGHGHTDGNDIGSGTMNVFCLVVDAEQAARTIAAELRRGRDISGAVIGIRRSEEDEAIIVHPARLKGQPLPS